jgi:hypothetical protein
MLVIFVLNFFAQCTNTDTADHQMYTGSNHMKCVLHQPKHKHWPVSAVIMIDLSGLLQLQGKSGCDM